MYYAIDPTGDHVRADDVGARRSRHRRFRCPVCKKRVYLRAGPHRVPHFAHMPGEGDPDCENYHPGSGSPDHHGNPGSFARKELGRSLYVVLDPAIRGLPRWRLEILVPAAPSGQGAVRVADSPHGEMTVQCSRLVQAARRVEVKPQSKSYRLIPINVDHTGYQELLRTPTPGLGLTAGSTFTAGSPTSRRLSDETPLKWGGSYIVLWPQQVTPEWPDEVRWVRLAPRTGWEAALIDLPATASVETERWAEVFLGRGIRHPPPQIGLVSPAILSVSDDGVVHIPAGEDIVIAVTNRAGSSSGETLEIISPSQEHTSIALPASGRTVLALMDLPNGRTELSLSDPDADSLVLQPLTDPLCAVATVEFLFRHLDREEDISVPAFSAVAESHLQRVRAGDLSFAGLTWSPGVRCSVRSRSASTEPWKEQHFVALRGGEREGAAQSEGGMEHLYRHLLTILDTAEVEVDFGNFGRVVTSLVSLEDEIRTLPRPLRNRILWLLSCPGEDVPASYCLAAAKTRSLVELNAQDVPILHKFFARERWPSVLLPHLIATGNELVHILGKAPHGR